MDKTGTYNASLATWKLLSGTALLYFLAGKFALLLAVPPGYATPIWPAAGIAMVSVLLFGRGVWPGIVIGHFLVNAGTSLDISTIDAAVKSVIIPIGIGLGGAAQAILGVSLIHRFVGWPNSLVSEREILRFFLLGGPISCLVSSTIGVSILTIAGIVEYDQIAFNWFVWWFGDTLGVFLAPPLLLVWFAKPEALWIRRRKLLLLPLVGAMVASILLYLNVTHSEQSRIESEFRNSSIHMASAIITNLNATRDIAETVADFIKHSNEFTREEFGRFVTPLLARYPYIKAISWEPILRHADRIEHENAARRDGFAQYRIWEKKADGDVMEAPVRNDYIPVYYLEPYVSNERALGFNLASEPKRLKTLMRATKTGQSAVSERLVLVQDNTEQHYSVILFHPVQNNQETGKTTKGFISVVIYTGTNVHAALKDINKSDYIITLKDLSTNEGDQLLATFGTSHNNSSGTDTTANPTIFYHVSLEMGGRKWAIEISPTRKYLDTRYSWTSWASLTIGALFSGLLAIFLLSVTGKSTEMERTVEERTREMTDLYNNAPCGYHSLDANGVFVKINDTELKWLGYSREEVIGRMKASDLMTEGSKKIFRTNFPLFLEKGEIHDIEFEFLRKDGSVFNILLSGTSIRDKQGEIVQSRSTIFDITERKEAEKALKEAEQYNRLILESIVEGVYGIDIEGRCAFANSSCLKLLGYTDISQLLGKNMHQLMHHTRKDLTPYPNRECRILAAFRENSATSVEDEVFWRADGTSFPVEYWSHPVVRDGKSIGTVVSFVDITARVRTTEKLNEAKEQAEKATQLKDKFVSLVSHDLKSPLATMIGYLRLFRHDKTSPPSESSRMLLDAGLKSADHMVNIIEDILNLSRIKSGKIQLRSGFMDAFLVTINILSGLEPMAREKGIKIVNNIQENTRIYADSGLIYEVIQNLVANAIKFCRKGDTITISVSNDEFSTITISDTGVGIDPDIIGKLFDYAEKTSTAGTSGEVGTGFGLPLCHDIMGAHGGELVAESTKGKGSTFYAKLPFVKPKVLVVEDEKTARTLYALHLKKLGAEVVEAENGREAFDFIENGGAPHLVITDLKMPEMDGFELIERIKQNYKTASIPVILLTADNSIKIRDKAFQLKTEDYMSKSIDLNDFIPRVRRFIG